jgi:hypothetical protein
MTEKETERITEVITGYILLLPSLLSVFLFFVQAFSGDKRQHFFDSFLSSFWTGEANAGGYTSALPIYFGLMAIAGVYLIKRRS